MVFPLLVEGEMTYQNQILPAREALAIARLEPITLAAKKGLDYRSPLKGSLIIEQAKQILRDQVSFYDKDRHFSPDIEKASSIISDAVFNPFSPQGLLPSL